MSALDIFFNTLNGVHNNITFTKELECGDSLALLDVLIEKTQSGIQTTTYRMHTHSCLYAHWTSFIPHHKKRNLVFGLLDRAYKIASTFNATHDEFMKIKSMLIKTDTPKHTWIAASWNISIRNMKPLLILSRRKRQTPPPSTCVSLTSGKFPMKSGEKCKDLYTAMPSCPCSFVSYMKLINFKIFYI